MFTDQDFRDQLDFMLHRQMSRTEERVYSLMLDFWEPIYPDTVREYEKKLADYQHCRSIL